MIKKLLIVCCLSMVFAGYVFSQSTLELASPDGTLRLRPHGYGHFRTGQIVRGIGPDDAALQVKGIYTGEAYGGLSMEVAYKEHLTMHFGVEVKMYFSYPQLLNFNITKQAREDVILGPTYGNFSYEKTRCGDFNFSIGYFDFKYNPDIKNLGEFMFRSATYPAYIITYMDYPMAKLLGTHLKYELFNKKLKQDLLFTTETSFYPAQDWSLSYLASANITGLEVGAGVSMSHLLSVYNDQFDPGLGSLTNPKKAGPSGNQYIDANGDTLYYTFQGNKVMARFSFDPKVFIPDATSLFGESDLKLYAEAIIIGTTSYPDTRLGSLSPQLSYKSWKEKMPITFGFNLPTFKILDVLNIEFEWWGSKYLNTYRDVYINTSLPNPESLKPTITESPWKWSVYTKKSFYDGHFSIVAQAARDHMRLPSAVYQKANHQEMLIEAGNWWWCLKTSFLF